MARLPPRVVPRVISDISTYISRSLRVTNSRPSPRPILQPGPSLPHRKTISALFSPTSPLTPPPIPAPVPVPAPLKPYIFPTSGFEILDAAEAVEEEALPNYWAEKYYPVRIGEVFHKRYQVLAKLGYGTTSTVWLCRDLVYVEARFLEKTMYGSGDADVSPSDSKYVVLKVYITGIEKNRELDVYNRINSVETSHMGKTCIRKLLGHFSVKGPHGDHTCLVHQALGISVDMYRYFLPGRVMSFQSLKPCLRQILEILDFLHTEAKVIHTDLQLNNLLLPASGLKTFSDLENAELEYPSARKILDRGRHIHISRILVPGNGLPLISDFGEARFGNEEHNEDIMPVMYRAPEVVLKMN